MNQNGFLVIEKQLNRHTEMGIWVLSLLASLGAVSSMLLTFVEQPNWPLAMVILAVTAMALVCPKKEIRKVILVVSGVALVSYLTIFGEMFRCGVLQLANNVIALYNYNTGSELYYYVVKQDGSETISFTLFVCFMIAMIEVLFYDLLKRKRIGAFVMMNLLFVVLVLLFKNQQAAVMCIFCCIAVPAVVMWNQMQEERTLLILMAIGLVTGTVISFAYMMNGEYQSNLTAAKMKSAVVQQADTMRYGELDSPQGDLVAAGSFAGSENHKLRVTASSPEVFYLKGYVGGEYKDNQWGDIDPTLYAGDYEGMFDWMSRKDFYPMTQNSTFIALLEDETGTNIASETIDITIENIAANEKYMYTPYGLHMDDIELTDYMNKDLNLYADDNASAVTFRVDVYDTATAFSLENPTWMNTETSVEAYANFRDAQVEYRTFVYDSYLHVEQAYKDYFDDEFAGAKLNGYVTITNYIREWLENKDTLKEQVKTQDYLLYFMQKTKQGNSCYYASSATVMYRYFGIPARYVEGYLADLRDVEEGANGYEKMLTGQNVHAWVEIYKDGIGWIPVEVTPGFYSDLEVEQQSVVQQELQQTEEEEEEQEAKRKIQYKNITTELLLGILLLITLGILVVLLRRLVICHLRKRRLAGDREVQMQTIIRWMKQLLTFNHQTEDMMEQNVIDILRKYRFCDKKISEEDYLVVKEYAYNMQQSVFQMQDRKGKLRMKYVWALI